MPNIYFIINEPNNLEMLEHYRLSFLNYHDIKLRLILNKTTSYQNSQIKIFKNYKESVTDIDIKIGVITLDINIKRNLFSPNRIANLIFNNTSFKNVAIIFNGTPAILKECDVLSVTSKKKTESNIPNFFDSIIYAYEFKKYNELFNKKLPNKNSLNTIKKNTMELLNKLCNEKTSTEIGKQISELLYFSDVSTTKTITNILTKIKKNKLL